MAQNVHGPQLRRSKIPQGIVFNDVLNIYINFQTTKTTIFQSIKSYIFPKGLTHDSDPKIISMSKKSNFSTGVKPYFL